MEGLDLTLFGRYWPEELFGSFWPFVAGMLAFVFLSLLPLLAFCWVFYKILGLPLRRQERVEFLLDLLETAESEGKSFADAVLAAALGDGRHFRRRFQVLAARLTKGPLLDRALRDLPFFLPAQILALLQVGVELGDIRKVLPACRRWVSDGKSRTLSMTNYVIPLMVFQSSAGGMLVLIFHTLVILPKFQEIFDDMLEGAALPVLTQFMIDHRLGLAAAQLGVLLLLVAAVLVYVVGPHLAGPFRSLNDRAAYCIPWRRKRLQRDFCSLFAILLDAGLPEARAVTLAARSTANKLLIRRAQEVVHGLEQGVPLHQAVGHLDSAGEFRWRLRNAMHAPGGFAEALAGWHDALDAKAYQQEQAAAHVISTALVLVNALIVSVIAVGLFRVLVELIHRGAMW
jgi:type IV pilus assembly protein PilC